MDEQKEEAGLEFALQGRPTPRELIAEIVDQEIREFQDRPRRESQSTADGDLQWRESRNRIFPQ